MANQSIQTTNTPNRTLDEVMNGNDLSQWIMKNKNSLIIAVVVLLLGGFGYSIYQHFSSEKAEKQLSEIYLFKKGALTEFKEKKLESSAFVAKFNELAQKNGTNKAFFLVALEVAQELKAQGATNDGIKVLESVKTQTDKSSYAYFFLIRNLAVLKEDIDQVDESIALLEELTQSKTKLMQANLYFDLGRLYALKGNKEKAKTNFDYLVANFPEHELVKLAKVSLQNLN